MAPKLRANDYYGGIDEALNAITQIVQGEALPAPVTPDESHERRRGGGGSLLLPLIFGFIFLRGILGRAPLDCACRSVAPLPEAWAGCSWARSSAA